MAAVKKLPWSYLAGGRPAPCKSFLLSDINVRQYVHVRTTHSMLPLGRTSLLKVFGPPLNDEITEEVQRTPGPVHIRTKNHETSQNYQNDANAHSFQIMNFRTNFEACIASTVATLLALTLGLLFVSLQKRRSLRQFPRSPLVIGSAGSKMRELESNSKNTKNGQSKLPNELKAHIIAPMLTHRMKPFQYEPLGIRIIAISDTHGHHRGLDMPAGDVLIHAGDFTLHGKREHIDDFNEWLGELPYKYKFVVNGNHENNASWSRSAKGLLTNATLLTDEWVAVDLGEGRTLRVHGMQFQWPVLYGAEYDLRFQKVETEFGDLNTSLDVLISHCPAEGYVDSKHGCPALTKCIEKVKPRILICGHIHSARGIAISPDDKTVFVNCATAKGGIRGGHSLGQQPIELIL